MLKGYHNAADARLQSASVSLGKVASKLGSLSSVVYWRAMESELWSLLPFSLAVAATVWAQLQCSLRLYSSKSPINFQEDCDVNVTDKQWSHMIRRLAHFRAVHSDNLFYSFFFQTSDATPTALHSDILIIWNIGKDNGPTPVLNSSSGYPSQQKDQSPSRDHQYITAGLLRKRLPTHDLKCAF